MLRLYPLILAFLVATTTTSRIWSVEAACQSCLLPAIHRHPSHPHPPAAMMGMSMGQSWRQFHGKPSSSSLLTSLSGLVVVWKKIPASMAKPVAVAVGVTLATRIGLPYLRQAAEDSEAQRPESDDETTDKSEEEPVSGAMISAIYVYKNYISPLLPPACRFVPSCSGYGVQAIEEFGATKGAILTAWRILRCSPLGGKGYDPPRWPPVAYTYSSY